MGVKGVIVDFKVLLLVLVLTPLNNFSLSPFFISFVFAFKASVRALIAAILSLTLRFAESGGGDDITLGTTAYTG